MMSAQGPLTWSLGPMVMAEYTSEPTGIESKSACECCGRAIYEGRGWLLCEGQPVACYEYRWSEGHEVAFALAVSGVDGEHMREGFVAIGCRQVNGDLSYSVTEAANSPWQESEIFGPLLSRQEALDPSGKYPDLWLLVDAITAREARLSTRILKLFRAG